MSEKKEQHNKCCENCLFSVDNYKSVQFIRCVRGKRSKCVVKTQPGCKDYADKK